MADSYPTCSRCGSEKLSSVFSICTDSDPMSDSYMLWSRCTDCDARYIIDIKEEVNFAPDDGHIINRGSSCDPAEWDRTLMIARRCPRPDDYRCKCAAHTDRPTTIEAAWYRSW